CHMEGFVYRFMPVVVSNQVRGMGGLTDTERNYELLVERTSWGNLNRDHVTVDRESYRNVAIPRNSFMRLAQAFLREGNKEKAIETMDSVIRYFPNHKILYDIYMYAYVELYYEAEAPDKAVEVASTILNNLSAELKFIDSLPFKDQAAFGKDREQYLGVLGNMSQLAERNQQPEFKAQVDEVLAAHPRRG
ncbi:MAG: tetratricopeptide repeat protein, partial [Bacteroidales bacterium]|nr:tetratricopeptide repeat protein [Bacteroidales bacterium]